MEYREILETVISEIENVSEIDAQAEEGADYYWYKQAYDYDEVLGKIYKIVEKALEAPKPEPQNAEEQL